MIERPKLRMMFAPYSGYVALAYCVIVFILINCDYPVGTYSATSIPFYYMRQFSYFVSTWCESVYMALLKAS